MKKNLQILIAALFAISGWSNTANSQSFNWLWANNAGGTGDDFGNNIAVDNSGNSYVTGYFISPTITFGSTTLTNAGGYDAFIVKYSPSGTILWAARAGGSDHDYSMNIAVDNNGNAYITGYYSSSEIVFGTDSVFNALPGTADFFIAKYDAAGNVLWAMGAGGAIDSEISKAIAVDGSGNCYITGSFFGSTIYFGSDSLTNAGGSCFGALPADVFVAKYSSTGNFLWARSAGGNQSDEGLSIAVDGSGNCCVTGFFRGSSITFGSTTLTNAGGTCNCGCQDIFIVKYDPSGNVLWATSAGGSVGGNAFDGGYGISVDGNGNFYVTGSFVSTSIAFGSTTLTNAGGSSDDFFIVKYSPTGNVLWAKSAGGTDVDWGQDVAVDASGNSYVTGGFWSSSILFGSTTLTYAGGSYSDFFIAKYDAAGNVLGAAGTGGNNDDAGGSVSLDASGNCYIMGTYNSSSISFGSITLTNAGGYDAFIAKLEGIVGINDVNGNKFSLFPNPATTQLTVNKIYHATDIIEIFDVMGSKVMEMLLNPLHGTSASTTLDVSAFAPGVYVVRVKGEEGEGVAKFLKQ